MRRLPLLAFWFLLPALVCFAAAAQEDRGVRSRLKQVLGQRDMPHAEQWWKALGPSAPASLMSLYSETDHTHQKARVIEALRFFPDKKSVAFLKEQATESGNGALRRIAIGSLVRSQGMKEKDFIVTQLASADPFMRAATAGALQELPDAQAQKMVSDFVAQETVPWVITRLHQPQTSSSGPFRRVLPGPDPRR